jgi:hypothetical protein
MTIADITTTTTAANIPITTRTFFFVFFAGGEELCGGATYWFCGSAVCFCGVWPFTAFPQLVQNAAPFGMFEPQFVQKTDFSGSESGCISGVAITGAGAGGMSVAVTGTAFAFSSVFTVCPQFVQNTAPSCMLEPQFVQNMTASFIALPVSSFSR